MQLKQLPFRLEGMDEQGVFTGYASIFDVVDTDLEVIHAGAFRQSLDDGSASGGVLIFPQHRDNEEPIGKTLELQEDDRGLYVKGFIADTTIGQDYRKLIKAGILDRLSIGFIGPRSAPDENGVRHIYEADLREISVVNYPANHGAKIETYKGGTKPVTKTVTKSQESNKEKTIITMSEEELTAMLAEAAQQGAAVALEAIAPAGEAAPAANDPVTDPVADPAADPEDDTKDGDPEDEKQKGKKSAKAASRPIGQQVQRKYADIYVNQNAAPRQKKSNMDPGIGWVRYNKAMMRANQDPEKAAYIAKHAFANDELAKEIKAMSVTSPSDGGYLVPEVYASEIIPLLRPKAIVLALGATELPMDRGNLNIPKMLSGTSAGYVGEMRKSKGSKPKFGNIHMSSKKLMAKVVISNDLIRSNAYSADQLILNDATTAMALAMDGAALFGKGTEFEPLGLLKMDGVPKVALDGPADERTTGKLMASIIQNNANAQNLGWAINGFAWEAFYNVVGSTSGLYLYRDQMDQGKLNGNRFAISNQLTNGTGAHRPTNVILGDWSEYMIGRQGNMESEMFREGSVTDENGDTVSAVDQDCTILRIIDLHDFGVRHEESFVIGTGLYTA